MSESLTQFNQEKPVHCPYDPKHIMPVQSLLKHLSTCKATNKSEFKVCRFNQLHVYKKHLIEQHENQCPNNNKIVETYEEDEDWNKIPGSSVVKNFDNDYQKQEQEYVKPDKKKPKNDSREEKNKSSKEWLDETTKSNMKKEKKSKEEQEPFKCNVAPIKNKAVLSDF